MNFTLLVEAITLKYFGILTVLAILVIAAVYGGNYLSYYNCMSQTKSNTITQKGADHVAAQCRTFILEKAMTN